MHKGLVYLLALACLYLPGRSTHADNWPRFRGPNGTGVADDKDVPVQFDVKTGKNVLWKWPLPGLGNSSPVIWDKYLFIQSATPSERMLLCLNAEDGTPIWKRSLPGIKAPTHPKNTLASSTPATDGKIVVTAFWDGKGIHLVAYDFQGNQKWDNKLGPWFSQHGPGGSPIIYKDKVFYVRDMDAALVDFKTKEEKEIADPSRLYCFDKESGKPLWDVSREGYRACYSAPFILEKPGADPELVVTSTTSIRGYNLESGRALWNWTWTFTSKLPLRTTASSIYANGYLFACSGDGGGDRHMIAIKLSGSGTATKAELAWDNNKKLLLPYVPTVLSRGEHLYFVNDKGYAGCFHAATGKVMWQQRLVEASAFVSSPVLIDGKMYAASEEGEFYVIAAEPAYKLLAKTSLGERVRASLAVSNNRLYIRGQNHLFCIGNK